jgi:ABC-2 type transport system permease protein
MIRLLKIEALKNFAYRPFKIFSILYFTILAFLLFIGLFNFSLFGFDINLKDQGFYDLPELWNFTTWLVGLFKIFLGSIIVFSITQEFTNRMFKQNIIDGLSRKEFITSKVLTILVFSFFSTLVVFLFSLGLGLAYSEESSNAVIFKEIYFIGTYFLKLVTFFSFLLFMSILFRNAIFAFLGFIIWWIIEVVITIAERAIHTVNIPMEEHGKVLESKFLFYKYLPFDSMASLVPAPWERTNLAKAFGKNVQMEFPTESVIMCVIYTAVFIGLSYWILKKRDW